MTGAACPIDAKGRIDLPLLRAALSPSLGQLVAGLSDARFDGAGSTTASVGRVMLDWRGSSEPGPASLFFKRCQDAAFDGASEIDFYTRDYAGLPDAPIPACFAHGPVEGGGYWLLLQDLTETHRDNKDVPPDDAVVTGFATSIARLHRHGWGQAADATAQFNRFMAHVRTGLQPMLQHLGDSLSDADRALILYVFETHPPRFAGRLQAADSLCLLHGDANPTNLLSPIDGHGTHYLIDRQPFAWSLRNGPGPIDLVTQSIPFWPIAERRHHQQAMLDRYHKTLNVPGYDREGLMQDYALSVPHALYIAVEWCSDPEDMLGMQWLWSAQLERALAALSDMGWTDPQAQVGTQ